WALVHHFWILLLLPIPLTNLLPSSNRSPYIIRSNPALVQEIFGDEQEATKQSVLAAAKWRSMMGPDMGKGCLGGTKRWHAGWALWVSCRHLAVCGHHWELGHAVQSGWH
ncbi:hypothetical protein EDD22DRAFT_879604, partial [Suillus occidentalis]